MKKGNIMTSRGLKIFILSKDDISAVIASTEAYYVSKYLSFTNEVHIFGPIKQKIGKTRIHRTPPFFRGFANIFFLNIIAIPYFLQEACRNRPDIVYSYKGFFTIPIIFKKIFNSKIVYDFQTAPVEQKIQFSSYIDNTSLKSIFSPLLYKLLQKIYKFLLNKHDIIITLSKEVKTMLVRTYYIKTNKIFIIPLGVDTELFNPSLQGSQEFPRLTHDKLNLVYIGSIALYRGLQTVLEAIKILVQEIPNLHFYLAGSGKVKHIYQLKKNSKTLEINENVTFMGLIPHEKIPELLSVCDIALSPLPNIEAYKVSSPAKIFEYMAMGKIIIATDILAHQKIIKHMENGILITPESPVKLAEAIKRVYTDRVLWTKLQIKARESSLEHSWIKKIEKINKELTILINEKS